MHTIAIRMAYPSVFGSVLFGQFTPHCCLISAILVVVLAACHAPLRALRALDQPATKLTGTTIDTPAPICCARLIFSFKGILRVSLFEGVGGQRSALPIRRPAPFLQLPSLLSQAILLAFKVGQGAEFSCAGCIVRDNRGDGVHLDVSAAATIQLGFLANGFTGVPPAITRNSGNGVYVGDLSSATFKGASTVTANGQPNISCTSPTSVTRGALTAAGGSANTNCTN